jgi:FHA domain
VPEPVLTLLKYVFLAVLYLFFLRVLRAVWVELREPKPQFVPPDRALPADSTVTRADGAVVGLGTGGEPPPGGLAGRAGPERLVVVDPAEWKGSEFPIGDEVTVGRAGGCAVLLAEDTFVSQLHARLYRRNGDLYVEDLGSTNGTFVNKKRVTAPAAVRKGDRIQFGRTTVEVRK